MSEKKIRTRFNMEELRELLRDFYTITKTRIVVFDDELHNIAAYPTEHSTYCEILQEDPRAKKACRECDEEGCRICKKKKSLHIYECYAGLVEVVIPLMDGDIIVGYLMLGQVILEDDKSKQEKWQELFPKVAGYQINFGELQACFNAKRRITRQTILAAAKIMETCASHLYLTKMVEVQEEDLSRRIEEYMEQHLRDEITAELLCREFGLKRTKLYELFNHSFGGGVAQYTRKIRVRKAEELLGHTQRKISDIADEIGFPDYNYFTKVFKKETGLTPRDYRKQKAALREDSFDHLQN